MSLFVVIILEAVSYVAGAFLEKWSASIDVKRKYQIYYEQKEMISKMFRSDTNDIFDPDLGWAYRPNYHGRQYNNNSIGLRGTREYEPVPPQDIIRIAAFGDSFVYGSEVGDLDTWTYQLESLLPNVEVLNFGIGGYGTDQAFLRYLKLGKQFSPHIVLIGFMSANLRRNVNIYRRFINPSELVHFKPRFTFDDNNELVLLPSPVKSPEEFWRFYERPELIKELGHLDFSYKPFVYENPFYDYSASIRLLSQVVEAGIRRVSSSKRLYNGRYFNPESEAFRITVEILKRFNAEVKTIGATPIVLMFPGYDDISGDVSRRVKGYQPLVDELRLQHIEVVDLSSAFGEVVTKTQHFMRGGHFSPHSNRLVAEFLAGYLSERLSLQDVSGATHEDS